MWRSICLFRPWCLGGTRSAIPRLDCSRDIDFLRGEFNSLAVNVVLGLVALARGVLLSRGVEIVVHGSFEAASSPSVHPFSSSGLVFFCNPFRALSTCSLLGLCSVLCVSWLRSTGSAFDVKAHLSSFLGEGV